MRCGRARAAIQTACEAPLAPPQAQELESHTANCPACASYAQDFATLSQWTAELPIVEPPANFEWRLKLRIAQAEREATGALAAMPVAPRRFRAAFEFGGAFVVAAAVVVAVGVSMWRGQTPTSPSSSLPPAPAAAGRVTPLRDSGPQPSGGRDVMWVADSLAADSLAAPQVR